MDNSDNKLHIIFHVISSPTGYYELKQCDLKVPFVKKHVTTLLFDEKIGLCGRNLIKLNIFLVIITNKYYLSNVYIMETSLYRW